MSITGQPQEINTVKSSWEILDSPVPLKSESKPKSRTLLSVSNTVTSLRAESSGYSTEQHLNLSDHQISGDTSQKHASPTITVPNSQTLNPELDRTGRLKTEDSISQEHIRNKIEEFQKEPYSRGTATYVSSQRRPTEDFAETIAAEFEKHARKSYRPIKRELDTEAKFRYLEDQLLKEDTENSHFRQFAHEDTVQLNACGENDPNSKSPSRVFFEESNSNVIDTLSPDSRDYSQKSRESISTAYQGQISCSVASVSHSEKSDMSHVSVERTRHVVNNRNTSERRLYRNSQGERSRPTETIHNQYNSEDQRYSQHEAQNNRPISQDSKSSSRHVNDVRFPQIHAHVDDNTMLNEEVRRELTPRGDSATSNATRSMPEVMNHPNIPATTDEDTPIPRQMIALANMPLPTFHPPPTIIQNGISQADLLELMSKGLGQFTTEMTVMVLEKMKPEYEALAKQVGEEVKESTITELRDLREKLTNSEAEVEALTVERDNLKTENVKERDQIKKEFEKDRLKRVKEFEEKKERIDNLQKENDQFKSLLKEKDKLLKKAESKAKSEEQKRNKFEEESGKKQKELQKELDKIKGELLVQKSKKRLQVSSASKKECLGKLNSQHGYPRQFNGHKPISYDEGDD